AFCPCAVVGPVFLVTPHHKPQQRYFDKRIVIVVHAAQSFDLTRQGVARKLRGVAFEAQKMRQINIEVGSLRNARSLLWCRSQPFRQKRRGNVKATVLKNQRSILSAFAKKPQVCGVVLKKMTSNSTTRTSRRIHLRRFVDQIVCTAVFDKAL